MGQDQNRHHRNTTHRLFSRCSNSRDIVEAVDQAVSTEVLDVKRYRLAVLAADDLVDEIDLHLASVPRVGSEKVDLLLREDDGEHAILEAVLLYVYAIRGREDGRRGTAEQ